MKVHPSEMAGLGVSRFGEQTGVGPGNSILAVDPGLVMGMGYCNESTRSQYAYVSPEGGTSVLAVIIGMIACLENNGIWISKRSVFGGSGLAVWDPANWKVYLS